MILMIQKNRVTSGTLFSIVRASDRAGCGMAVVVMRRRVGDRTLRLPDCRQHQDEAAARTVADDDVAAAAAGEPARQRQAEPGGAARGALPPYARFEDLVAEPRVEAGAVVADSRTDLTMGCR